MIEQAQHILRSYWLILLVGFLLVRALYRRYLHPLHNVPGPFFASITSLWFTTILLSDKKQHLRPLELHAKYGPLVRIRPNTVIVADPNHFGDVFGWPKSDFFHAFRAHPEVFSHGNEMDLEAHNVKKKRIMGGFTVGRFDFCLASLRG
jgi:hypothetical protein